MIIIKKFLFILASTSIFISSLFCITVKDWEKEKEKAEILYNKGQYDEAIILFRDIIISSNNEKLKAEMYFWLGKAYMGTGQLELSEKNLEYYISNYSTTGLNYPESLYQKGRLLFLQEEYQSSIDQLNLFIKKYQFHALISNAYYWIGECLYALGQFDDSSFFFNIVINKFPNSIKREASMYKLRLIEHKKSELALQNLLKWSQEQYITALNQFRIKEKTLREAMEEYEKGTDKAVDSDVLIKYKELESENINLQEKIKLLEQRIVELEKSITDKDLLDKLKTLELKEKLLKDKEETLKILEQELRKKEEALEK